MSQQTECSKPFSLLNGWNATVEIICCLSFVFLSPSISRASEAPLRIVKRAFEYEYDFNFMIILQCDYDAETNGKTTRYYGYHVS